MRGEGPIRYRQRPDIPVMTNPAEAVELCERLLHQGPGCWWVLDKDLTFGPVFGSSVQLFGKPAADLSGAGLHEIVPPARGKVWRKRVARVLRGEALALRERGAGGLLFSVRMFPVRNGGAEIAFAGCAALEITALESVEQKLRHTVLNVLRTQETERARLARFLHDEVGQCLSAAGLQLDLLRMDAETNHADVPGRTQEVQRLLETVMEQVREFSYELNPSIVDRAGLGAALDRMASRVRRRFSGAFRLAADASLRFDAAVAGALYKIAEEAVNNAVRHAGCGALEVVLKRARGGYLLEVRDNGRGFDTAEVNPARGGMGIPIMQHCAAEAGIELAITSNRGRGTSIKALVRRE
jgi:signal transduction histidine kinase